MSLRPTSVWRRTPLWLRLITTLLALSIVALTVMGVFGARLLRQYLVERVDDQLVTTANGVAEVINRGRPVLVALGQYHITLQDEAGVPVQRWESELLGASAPDLPPLTPTEASDRGGRPFTVRALRSRHAA